jgi:aspartyl-tRNA(Asn)/glutamyl-tRNA(Gln) amidotransferase subunit A
VAARLVFGSLGSDTGGSIRHPAAMCGITGLKPTWRRVSSAGVLPLSTSLDCPGPMAQTARDCARLLTLIARPDARDGLCTTQPAEDYEARLDGDLRGLRIGVPQGYYCDGLDPQVAAALEASLDVLRRRGATLVAVGVPDMALVNALAQVVMGVEAAAVHGRWLAQRPQDYADQVLRRIEPGLAYPAVRYVEALALRRRVTLDWIDHCLADCDLVHLPTLPMTTPTIAATTLAATAAGTTAGTSADTNAGDPAAILQALGRVTHATRGINYLGLPAISVPAGFSDDGLPLAFQLVARPYAEGVLLQAADAHQRDTDWHRRLPPCTAPAAVAASAPAA